MKKKTIEAFIEIPTGSAYKYEMDFGTGNLFVDRPLPAPLPYNYGFIPGTMFDDGDPLDICVYGAAIFPTAKVEVEILGAFLCDDNGDKDDKIVAKVVGAYAPSLMEFDEVRKYLETYKMGFKVIGFVGAEDAMKIVQESLTDEEDSGT